MESLTQGNGHFQNQADARHSLGTRNRPPHGRCVAPRSPRLPVQLAPARRARFRLRLPRDAPWISRRGLGRGRVLLSLRGGTPAGGARRVLRRESNRRDRIPLGTRADPRDPPALSGRLHAGSVRKHPCLRRSPRLAGQPSRFRRDDGDHRRVQHVAADGNPWSSDLPGRPPRGRARSKESDPLPSDRRQLASARGRRGNDSRPRVSGVFPRSGSVPAGVAGRNRGSILSRGERSRGTCGLPELRRNGDRPGADQFRRNANRPGAGHLQRNGAESRRNTARIRLRARPRNS